MRIIFTAQTDSWKSPVDQRFGRANGFFLYDQKTKEIGWYPNTENQEAGHGAGVQAAQKVSELRAEVIITGNLGPKASEILKNAGIKVYKAGESATLTSAYDDFKNNVLETN
jgi:predicted Fe-Mo cluster-binding NifX family protein